MALASQAVDAIFARMAVRYGSAWLAKWDGVPIDAVKADWARELDGLGRDAILYALGYLPTEFPPTVAQFRVICLRAPEANAPRIEAPRASKAVVDAAMARMARRLSEQDPRDWARRLRDREVNHGGILENGHPMTITQRVMWRAALNAPELGAASAAGGFMGIEQHALPPAMRPAEYEPEWAR